jgi:hypothetical protein
MWMGMNGEVETEIEIKIETGPAFLRRCEDETRE